MRTNISVKIKPFQTPNYAIVEDSDMSSIHIRELDEDTLSDLCDQFRVDVFKKSLGIEEARVTPNRDGLWNSDMNSVPNDGTAFDVYHPERGRIAFAICLGGQIMVISVKNNNIGYVPMSGFTHWMPIPKDPQ